jgi:hypothetical protein
MSGAARMRKHRALHAAGKMSLSVEVDSADLESVLQEAGLISPLSEPSREELSTALSKLLARIFSNASLRPTR